MEIKMEQEFEMIALVYKLEEAGYSFADASDKELRQAFMNNQDLRDLMSWHQSPRIGTLRLIPGTRQARLCID